MVDGIRVALLTRSLEVGGAERQFIHLANHLSPERFEKGVFLFYPQGALLGDLSLDASLALAEVRKLGRWDILHYGYRLYRAMKAFRPDVILSFLDAPNIAALLLGWLLRVPVVISLRATNMDFSRYGWIHAVIYRLSVLLSHLASRIVVNARSGVAYHARQGVPLGKMRVVHNGIDIHLFRPKPGLRRSVRRAWGVDEESTLIGLVARLDPMKDHLTFLRAAARLGEDFPQARFVCVGDGPSEYAQALQTQAQALGIGDRVIWAGRRADMPAIYNALDVLVSSSSYGEGFSNVIGEAMACGVPCVVTDVGDSAHIVGDTGLVVPPRQPEALADALARMLRLTPEERRALGQRARRRIETHFSLDEMVRATERLLLDVVRGQR